MVETFNQLELKKIVYDFDQTLLLKNQNCEKILAALAGWQIT